MGRGSAARRAAGVRVAVEESEMGANGGQARRGSRRAEPTRAKLRERVKELDCIYGIAQVAARWNSTMERDAQDIVELLPRAWQHPEAAPARDGQRRPGQRGQRRQRRPGQRGQRRPRRGVAVRAWEPLRDVQA